MKKKIATIFVFMLLTISFSGCGCKTSTPAFGLKLEIWGINDDADAYSVIFRNYTKLNPRIKEIVYRKFSADTYKKELLEALASGKGPDIFMINSTWEPSFRNKIVSAPTEIINEKMFRDNFVDLTSDAFITGGQIYAVPLSVDSLALYYNKDLFSEAGITNPPTTWDELTAMIPRLTKINNDGQIIQAGAALGTAYNINRSTDILGLLMLQNKTEMTTPDGSAVIFGGAIQTGGMQALSPAELALDFYTGFAKINSPYYSWNSTQAMHYSLDAFAEGTLAMMLNYSWHADTIRSKAPKLNFTVAPVPQIQGYPKVDFGNCYGYVVALNKKPEIVGADPATVSVSEQSRINETWKFLKYLAFKPEVSATPVASGNQLGGSVDLNLDPAKAYLEKTKKPAARKDLIEEQKEVYELGVFAEQNLIARNWKQKDPEAIEAIMGEMIDNVNRGKSSAYDALQSATSRINQAIKTNAVGE